MKAIRVFFFLYLSFAAYMIFMIKEDEIGVSVKCALEHENAADLDEQAGKQRHILPFANVNAGLPSPTPAGTKRRSPYRTARNHLGRY